MNGSESLTFEIGRATAQERGDALRLLFSSLPDSEREKGVETALREQKASPGSLRGLWVARRDEQIVGVVQAKMQAGRTAVVYPPQIAAGVAESTADRLLQHIDGLLASEGTVLAQALIRRPATVEVLRLERAGYELLTDLEFLVCGLDGIAAAASGTRLEFERFSEDQGARLEHVIRRTYAETLDCPQLNDVRAMSDVVAGHRATGDFSAERWSFARHEDTDIGCLLLAKHHGYPTWELVYMGIVPEARGSGFGVELVRHAQRMAAAAGATSMVLAMDARNQPARAMYERAGFADWDRRSVFWKQFSSPSQP